VDRKPSNQRIEWFDPRFLSRPAVRAAAPPLPRLPSVQLPPVPSSSCSSIHLAALVLRYYARRVLPHPSVADSLGVGRPPAAPTSTDSLGVQPGPSYLVGGVAVTPPSRLARRGGQRRSASLFLDWILVSMVCGWLAHVPRIPCFLCPVAGCSLISNLSLPC